VLHQNNKNILLLLSAVDYCDYASRQSGVVVAGQVFSISILAKYWNINDSTTTSDFYHSGTIFDFRN